MKGSAVELLDVMLEEISPQTSAAANVGLAHAVIVLLISLLGYRVITGC